MALELDEASIRNAAKDVEDTAADVKQDLRRLGDSAERLRASWQGQAATRFQELMTEWHGEADKLTAAMTEIGNLLHKSGEQHAANEEDQAASFASISVNPMRAANS